ncbi:hypothetical protein E2C01_003284 [Portunus trituberculatus]|uniref:Uncharacterized protein n=1 Tax=Portunus trituberculatus TaxID=210409 RepID=A0A5B7CNB1_PORTR|nr:hypothetical protein [Portunus trituberculatus]
MTSSLRSLSVLTQPHLLTDVTFPSPYRRPPRLYRLADVPVIAESAAPVPFLPLPPSLGSRAAHPRLAHGV